MNYQEYVIVFLVAWISATISGIAGFGGALIFLPILTNIIGVKEAVPVLTIAQIFGNASRVWFGRHNLQWKPVIYFLAGALPFTILGSYLFADLKSEFLAKGIGILLILIIIYRRLKIKSIHTENFGMALGGGLTGFLSGMTGSAGPLGAAFFLGLELPAIAYIASEAFTALSIHLTKIIIYQKFSLIGINDLYLGLFTGTAMILGSWSGKRIIEKLPKDKFILIAEILLLFSAIQLIFFS